jgi:hypothetical protein
MLRLTLRSRKDGRLLARIIDSGGNPFVLDMGDRRIIDDAHQRILHGFTLLRYTELYTIHPQDPDFLVYLADYYAHEGLLVFFEEPNWEGRGKAPALSSLEDAPPVPASLVREPEPRPLPVQRPGAPSRLMPLPFKIAPLEPDEDAIEDAPTDIAELDGLTDLGPHLVDAED